MSEPIRLGMLNAPGVPCRAEGRLSCVYSLTNIHDQARYIGSTTNLSQRWASHRATFRAGRQAVNRWLGDALDAFGIDAFAVDLLEVIEPDDVALETAERRWIEHYMKVGPVPIYNIIRSGHREPVKARRRSPHPPGGRQEGGQG